MNRYVWDLRYAAPDALQHTYPISALYERTHAEPQGPFVVPGKYEVRLTVDGKTYKQPLTVRDGSACEDHARRTCSSSSTSKCRSINSSRRATARTPRRRNS